MLGRSKSFTAHQLGSANYVYLVQQLDGSGSGPMKIGVARDFRKRMAGLQVASPHELAIRSVILGNREVEAAMHDKFRHLRMRGEWFTGSREILDEFDRIAAMLGAEWLGAVRELRGEVKSTEFWPAAIRLADIRSELLGSRFTLKSEVERMFNEAQA
jgi:hypothetical protein